MPEGHSIHRLARAFSDCGVGRTAAATSPQGRFASDAARLDGRVLTESWAWGKHLFLGFDAPGVRVLHVHLGLYGSWRFSGDATFPAPTYIGAPRVAGEHFASRATTTEGEWVPPEPIGAVRLRLNFGHGLADLTGPATCELLDEGALARVLARLGPDPLRPECNADDFVARVRASARPVGALTMDQSVIAGPGNIYRAECLFRVGINPWRKGSATGAARLRALYGDLAHTMADGVETGQITTVRAHDIPEDGEADPESRRFYVYHRAGRACLVCATPIREADMAGRRLFWCPRCQR